MPRPHNVLIPSILVGINMNFAPDVDVNVNPKNPVIGNMGRSYSTDEKIVEKHAASVVNAHRKNNVLTVFSL